MSHITVCLAIGLALSRGETPKDTRKSWSEYKQYTLGRKRNSHRSNTVTISCKVKIFYKKIRKGKGIYIMTKFEQVGVNMQYDSATKEIAIKRFTRSCDCCCHRGMKIDCDKCAIDVAHKLMVASFESEV